MDFDETNQVILNLTDRYTNFTTILGQTDIVFQKFVQSYIDEDCPTQEKLAPILINFERMALAFSKFLESMDVVIKNTDAIQALKMMPPETRGIGHVSPGLLLSFYGASRQLSQTAIENSLLCKQVAALGVEYAYYGSSMSASSSLVSMMSFFTGIYEKPSNHQEWEIYLEFAPKLLKKEYVKGLVLLAERAAFLATATLSEIEASEIAWWCSRVDMSSKDEGALYTLTDLIKNCPDVTNPDANQRLRMLAAHQGIDASVRERAQVILDSTK